jgi:hypothetical protein
MESFTGKGAVVVVVVVAVAVLLFTNSREGSEIAALLNVTAQSPTSTLVAQSPKPVLSGGLYHRCQPRVRRAAAAAGWSM